MHKIRLIFKILAGLVFLFSQIFLSQSFSFYNLTPNFLIPFIIFISSLEDKKWLSSILFFLGLGLDLIYPEMLGFNTFTFLLIGFLVSEYHKIITFKIYSILVYCTVLNFLYYFLFTLFSLFVFKINMLIFLHNFFMIFFNSVFTIVIFFVLLLLSRLEIKVKL